MLVDAGKFMVNVEDVVLCSIDKKPLAAGLVNPSFEVLVGKELVGPNNLSCGYKVSNKFRANIPILWENHGIFFSNN